MKNLHVSFSISCFADATSQQGCIVKIYNRPRDRPYIKRCSATGGRHNPVSVFIDFFVLCPGGDSSVSRVFDWLAISYGGIFLMFPCAIFLWFSYIYAAQRLRAAAVSDRRISLMNQVVSGVRAIKTRGWEDEYRKKN